MPTYEFRCPDGHEFEKFYRKISAVTELACPVCGKLATRLVSGGAGLLFKGSGFYLTDYGKNAHRKAAPTTNNTSKTGGESTSGESSGESSGATAESKPSEAKSTDAKPAETKSSAEPKPATKPSSGKPKSDS